MVDSFLRSIAKPLHCKFSSDEKQEVLTWRWLKQVKSYIDDNLNPAKVNVIDSIKNNFTQPLTMKEILHVLKISWDDH